MGRRRKTTKEFIDEAIVTHGSLYDYSRVVYSGRNTPVEIICPKHGSFWQTPNNRLKPNTAPTVKLVAVRAKLRKF